MLTVTFDELEEVLAACDAPVGAAEAHGSLCGALAAVARFDADAWIGGLLSEEDVEPQALRLRNLLETLVAETQAALAGEDMEFEPLLPADEEPLERRVAALAEWCAGFLYGIGTGGLAPGEGAVPEAVDEVVRDFGEISRASIDAEETGESNEASYAEIVEYLRAGTQLAYEELEAHRAGGER
jgi:uncharacterized protein YgfB (UPF0149 family)